MEQFAQQLGPLFSEPLRSAVLSFLEERRDTAEEIRLRSGAHAGVVCGGKEFRVLWEGRPLLCDAAMLQQIVTRAAGFSVYAVEQQLRQGYLTLPGGHRLGLCGTGVYQNGTLTTIKEFSALNLRLARERPGAADAALNLLWCHPGSTLIVGPPGRGKTTVLRELIRQLSDRFQQRVCVVDERGELAACQSGVPQFQLGRQTDVLTGCGKREGIELLVRTMGPEWIALDEITSVSDVEAMLAASYCGVRFLATAHVWTREDLWHRPVYRTLMEADVFENLIELSPKRKLICKRLREDIA